jgi:hypothetical protein
MKEANSNAHGMIESNPYASSDEPEVNVSPVGRSSNQATSATKNVSLNVVEELMEVLQLEAYKQGTEGETSSEEETLMHISPCALAGVQSSANMRL